MDKKKKGIILSVLGILGLVVITAGVTYAFFNYAKEGTTDNVITTGSITFLYTEVSSVGNGINIENAYPISDEVGKVKTGEKEYFDFKITSDTMGETSIPYEVTARKKADSTLDEEAARKKADSTLDEEAVRIYLTELNGTDEAELLLDNYSNLTQTSKVESTKHIEKTIYTSKVPANTEDYEKNFRLRMWIDKDINFSQNEDGTYPYNGKTFTVTVNVYANAKVITADEEELLQNANLSSISVDGIELTAVENEEYNYETTLSSGTTETELNVVTESEDATVTIEKIDNVAYSSNIKRLSITKKLDLTEGDNYFKVTITSANKEIIKQYIVKIVVEKSVVTLTADDTLSVGTAVTAVDGSKWHVLEASEAGTETVVLLSDYNLNTDGTYNTSCGNDINGSSSCSLRAFDLDNTNTYDESDSNNIGYFIKNTYEPLVISALPGTTNVTLPTAFQILAADGKTGTADNMPSLSTTHAWLISTKYWTTTKRSSGNNLRYVSGSTSISSEQPNNTTVAGARSVITTPKTNLIAE